MGVLYEVCKGLNEVQNMDEIMTPEEFEEQMLTIAETVRMESERRHKMHNLVIDLLTELGYEVGAEIYAETVIER